MTRSLLPWYVGLVTVAALLYVFYRDLPRQLDRVDNYVAVGCLVALLFGCLMAVLTLVVLWSLTHG